jgi:hypothetical protein
MVFTVPAKGDQTGYSLGPAVAFWMEQSLVHGPGDRRGQPYRLGNEKRALLSRMYEIWPPETTTPEGKDIGGQRRFKRCAISVRKGWAKTELASAVAAAELHPYAPVRFVGWAEGGEETGLELYPEYAAGEAMGMGVTDPYVPMIAYTEEQSDELAYGALLAMLGEGPLADDFDLGLERIIVLGENGRAAGKAVALAGSPDARDGARTTFQCFDETHRMTLERLIKAHQTMLANAGGKRPESTPWSLEITTAFEPGLGSVAEGTMEYAQKVAAGRVENGRLFFFHRQAADGIALRDKEDRPDPVAMRAAVVEAGGPEVTRWSDVDAIVELGLDPQTDQAYWERVWLNRPIQQSLQAFPINKIDKLIAYQPSPGEEDPQRWVQPPPGSLVVFGFDGAQTRDTTALVGTEISTGRQFLYALWQNPGTEKTWHVPQKEVDEAVAYAFGHWNIWRLYADPYYWDTHVADWVAKYRKRGEPRVFEWATNTHKKMALSLKAYIAAMNEGTWSYDGNETFRAHLANARKHAIPILDEDGVNLFTIRKERPDSPLKIDAAMAGCLSWEAYRDAIAAGANRSYAFVEL